MTIRRFNAPTSREALAKARLAFGEGTLILSNRPTANGVEVVATAEDMLEGIERAATNEASSAPSGASARNAAATAPAFASAKAGSAPAPSVEQDAQRLAMSTLSFQDYVRERMLRRRHEANAGSASAVNSASALALPGAAQRSGHSVAAQDAGAPRQPSLSLPSAAQPSGPSARSSAALDLPAPVSLATPQRASATPNFNPQGIMDQLQSMQDLIEERFNTLAWLGQARQHPIHAHLMLKLIRAGFSPTIARAVLEHMPEALGASESVRWVMDVLERNIRTDIDGPAIQDDGGVFALVGATGVGKTTTAAKLAALCVKHHGPASVGLITLDTFRVAAHEQLRAFGRMLGVVAHLAHDRAALQDLLGLLAGKRLVLIDTAGMAPRDPRTRDMLNVMDLPGVQRLLVLNAGGHGDTLDEVLASYRGKGPQATVLSKVDEAAKLGPALDACIRHQLTLRGITTGQRVPEDWERADAGSLVRQSMRTLHKSAFDPKSADLGYYFAQTAQPLAARGALHA